MKMQGEVRKRMRSSEKDGDEGKHMEAKDKVNVKWQTSPVN